MNHDKEKKRKGMSTLFEQYQQARLDAELNRQLQLFTKADEILGFYRRSVLHRPGKDTATDLQAFFDLLEEGFSGLEICEKIEAYAKWLKGKPGLNALEFCDKVRESTTEDLF